MTDADADADYLTAAEWIALHYRSLAQAITIDEVIERLPSFNRKTFTPTSLRRQTARALRGHGFRRRHVRRDGFHCYVWER